MTPRWTRPRLDLWTAIRGVLFLAGLGFLVYLVIELDVAEILRLVASIGWHLVLLLAIYAGCQASRAAALWLCQPQAERAPYTDVLAVRVSAEAIRLATFVGPVLAEPSKVWLLGRRGLTTTEGIAAIVAELITHSLIATTLSIGALAYLISAFEVDAVVRTPARVLIWGMSAYVVGAVVAVAFRIYLIGAVAGLLHRTGQLRSVTDPTEVRRMEDMLLGVLRQRPARLLLILAFQVAANLCLILEAWVALDAMGFDVPWHYPLVIEGATKFVSVVFFFVPTQVGVSEGTYALVFGTLGLAAAGGVTLAFIRRLRTLAVAGVGLILITIVAPASPASGADR
jgi:hypothetical protein